MEDGETADNAETVQFTLARGTYPRQHGGGFESIPLSGTAKLKGYRATKRRVSQMASPSMNATDLRAHSFSWQ